MALKAGYYGIKKKMVNKLTKLTGIYSIGSGLNLSSAGALSVKNATTSQKGIVQLDEVPTENSTNVPMSGGVYSGIQDVYEVNGVLGAKNYWNYRNVEPKGNSGLTITQNDDGSIDIGSGTTSAEEIIPSQTTFQATYTLEVGQTYIFSVGTIISNASLQVYYLTSQGAGWTLLVSKSDVEEIEFTVPSHYMIWVRLNIPANRTTTGGTIYPMIRLASDTDATYQPYAMTNRQLTTSKANASALGTVENGTTASKAYAVGEHFSRFGDFCTVTQAIASGGTLTQGTNYSVGNVADKLFIKGTVTSSDDLNNITESGLYSITTAPTNSPESNGYCGLLVHKSPNGDIRQIVFKSGNATGIMYIRSYSGNPLTWNSWFKFNGTIVS